MFTYLLRIDSKDAMRRVQELATIVYQSRFSKVIGVEAQSDIYAALCSTPGVRDVQLNLPEGRLMEA